MEPYITFYPLYYSFQRDQTVASLNATLDYNQLSNADMVIEAVFEDIDLKHKVIRETEAVSCLDLDLWCWKNGVCEIVLLC